jgi:hypothetical protein
MKFRLLLALIISLGFFGTVSSQVKMTKESDLEIKKIIEEFIAKDIISSTLYRFDVDSGVVGTEVEKIRKTVIDKNKNILSIISFYPNYSRTVVSFDNNNDLTDITIYYQDNSVMSQIKTIYENDRKIKEKIYYFGNSFTFKVSNFYSSGNIIKQEFTDSLGKRLSYSKLFYDNSGNLIEEDKYNTMDSIEIVYSYLYDGKGNCTEELIKYPSSNITSKTVNKYDSDNKLVEKINYGIGDKVSSRNVYKYDASGKMIEDFIYSIDDKLTIKNEYSYDENGNKSVWIYNDFNEDANFIYKIVYNEK